MWYWKVGSSQARMLSRTDFKMGLFSSIIVMKLESITRISGKKEFKAVFRKADGKTTTTQFGTSSNFVLNPKKTLDDRKNYISRHRVNENFNDPTSAGSLSRHILWGDSRNLQKNISSFKKKFKI